MAIEGVVAMVEAGVVVSEEEDREGIKLSPSFMPEIHV
jgi:preprotein translocase subunit Sec61beta